ncbi:acyltransferase family protein [Microvirga sp. 2MCAF35]|uniref:acyltransferase family protein n=1 Tax=Microvirga sp. 2MCAF35 TaxID=3232987 RepID=UPI003F9AC43D
MKPSSERFEGVGMLRGIAALLVLYAHLGAQEMDREGATSVVVVTIRTYVTRPLNIIEDFGWFGVCLFFLISGFVITHSIQRETRVAFAVRRMLRLYPPLFFAAGVTILVGLGLRDRALPPLATWVSTLTLAGVPVNTPPFLGVEWTLFVEIKFYLLTLLVAPLLRSRPVLAYLLQAAFLCFVIYYVRAFKGAIFVPAISMYLAVYLLFGQIAYFAYMGRTSLAVSVGLALINYVICVYGMYQIEPNRDLAHNSQIVSLFYCMALFYGALYLKGLTIPTPLRFFEKISYSLYLLHGVVGIPAMRLAAPYVPNYELRFLIGLGAGTLAAWISYHLIEVRSIDVAKRLTSGQRLPASRQNLAPTEQPV